MKKNFFFLIIKKNYFNFLSRYVNDEIKTFSRHSTYDDYIKKQIEKTADPKKIQKWKGTEWETKVNGFRNLFKRNQEFLNNKKKALCLGSRTGQEVFVLRELGLEAIGIDLVEFLPFTIKGDIHNLIFEDKTFDLIFTNILDHSLHLEKFIHEMERVAISGGIIILNYQENIVGDDYSENIIYNSRPIIEMFKNSRLLRNRNIKNTFDQMNKELIFEKTY
jgi:hypothetical protein